MDEAKGAIVVYQLIAVQVLVIAIGFAGQYGLVVLQQVVGLPHTQGQEKEQEQSETSNQAICLMLQHFCKYTTLVFV